MWMFTNFGFFSAVSAKLDSGKIDLRRICVRARLKQHLESLCKKFKKELHGIQITESTHTDYRFRILLSKKKWTEIVSKIADDIDYCNYKDSIEKATNTPEFHAALFSVWGVMNRLQKRDYTPPAPRKTVLEYEGEQYPLSDSRPKKHLDDFNDDDFRWTPAKGK